MQPQVQSVIARPDIHVEALTPISCARYLLANEIDVLFYQGNLDLACNTAGNVRWSNSMPWRGQPAFSAKSLVPWTSSKDGKKLKAGTFKQVDIAMGEGKHATRFALVTIDGSGHLVSSPRFDMRS